MAKNAKGAPAIPPPPLPPTAQHSAPPPAAAPAMAVVAPPVPLVDVGGLAMEAHPVGTAQYIAELEVENAQALTDKAAAEGRASEGFKGIAVAAITHAAQMGGIKMAGHMPADISLIPGIDQINAEAR